MQAVCSGFLYALETGANFIRSGKYKKVIVVGADKMSSVIDYTDRATCPIFGDGAAAFMLEPTREDMGVMDAVLRTDGKGLPFLHIKAGGSVCAPSYYTLGDSPSGKHAYNYCSFATLGSISRKGNGQYRTVWKYKCRHASIVCMGFRG